jgi:hypothetical protein
MATLDTSHRIYVASSASASGSGVVWSVWADEEEHAVFAGNSARSRALESALRLAEELRLTGAVLVVIEPEDGGENVTRVLRSRLAS